MSDTIPTVKAACPACGATGYQADGVFCPACHGSGSIQAAVNKTSPCPNCNGAGSSGHDFEAATCRACAGTGRRILEDASLT